MDDKQTKEEIAHTLLTPEECEMLIPTYITQHAELNEAEQQNILDARDWLKKRKPDLLDDIVLRKLHKNMFGKVWKWAGKYRTSPRNIGIDAYKIPSDVRQLIHDVKYWIEHKTYGPDEISLRFGHRLVWIHPFPNGNGRFSRLVSDHLAQTLGNHPFSWGKKNLVSPGQARKDYISALRDADCGDYNQLIQFSRS